MKKIVIFPKLNNASGDLSKQWFIYYSCRDPKSDKMVRFRVYDKLSNYHTAMIRKQQADKIIKEYRAKLQNGWTPFTDTAFVYTDHLTYENIAKEYGRKRQSNITVRSHLSVYLDTLKSGLRKKSFQTYTSKLRIFELWLQRKNLHNNHISTIANNTVLAFFNFLINEKELEKKTITNYKIIIHSFFDSLIYTHVINENPVFNIPEIPKRGDYSAMPIFNDDAAKLKHEISAKAPQLWLAILFQYYCFIRPGTELRLMQLKQINFGGGTITIPEHHAKSKKTRTVTIPKPFLSILLHTYNLHVCDKELFVFGKNGKPGLIPVGVNTLRNRFNFFRDKLNLPDSYKLYSWKHTGALALSDANVPIKHIQKHMGHASIETTDIYLEKLKGIKSSEIENNYPEI